MSTVAGAGIEQRLALLRSWMTKRHGVAHTSDARAVGFSPRELAFAVEAGDIRRVRRSWIVAGQCDPRRVQAVSVGGRLTCVSAAALHGIWTPDVHVTHVAVPATASRFDSAGLRIHWSPGPAPVGRSTVDDPIVNVLFHVARCLEPIDALPVWESAIRNGRVDPMVLRRVGWRSTAAAAIAAVASELSDSGIETRFVHGMNAAGIPVRQQVWVDGHPLDGLIGDLLAIQLDGFAYHTKPADRRRDIRADARLALRGFTVLRFDHAQVLLQWDEVLDTVRLSMAQGLHRHPLRTQIR